MSTSNACRFVVARRAAFGKGAIGTSLLPGSASCGRSVRNWRTAEPISILSPAARTVGPASLTPFRVVPFRLPASRTT
jgi:hypothetical protein